MSRRIIRIMIAVGARPNLMKAAPLCRAIAGEVRCRLQLIHTGQHYDTQMSGAFFRELHIPPPDVNLNVGSGSHAAQTAQIIQRFESVCATVRPDWVVVLGDVNSTMACAIVATKLGVKVAHVEAGLRSFDRTMPEEINRVVTDSIADLHFTPSRDANDNLRHEGIDRHKIRFVGNIMIDALLTQLPTVRVNPLMKEYTLSKHRFVYVTLHRPSNVDQSEPLAAIIAHLNDLSTSFPVIFPIHPRTKKSLEEFGMKIPADRGLHVTGPLGYQNSLCLARYARFVLTDSGGLQEETTFFRTPCLTLRPNTERPITVRVGSNTLTSITSLRADIDTLLRKPIRFGSIPELWDGKTAERIVRSLLST